MWGVHVCIYECEVKLLLEDVVGEGGVTQGYTGEEKGRGLAGDRKIYQ